MTVRFQKIKSSINKMSISLQKTRKMKIQIMKINLVMCCIKDLKARL